MRQIQSMPPTPRSLRQRFICFAYWLFAIGTYLFAMLFFGAFFGMMTTNGSLHLPLPDTWQATLLLLPWVVATVWILWLATVVAHEAGHYLAGKVMGMKLLLFAIGPLVCTPNHNGRVHARWIKNRGYSGLCAMAPSSNANQNTRHYLVFISGGILANLFFAASGLIGLMWVPSGWTACLLAWSAINLLFLINLVPIQALGLKSDGAIIMTFLAGIPFARFQHELLQIKNSMMAGKRPSEIPPPELLETHLEKAGWGEAQQIAFYNYLHAIDSDHWEKAAHALKICSDQIDAIPPLFQLPIRCELSFLAGRKGDKEAARQWHATFSHQVTKHEERLDCNDCRIKAYYAKDVLEDLEEARHWANLGLKRCPDYPILGWAMMEHDLLQKLLSEVTPSLHTPESQSA
jgi:hypothetical protein